MFKEEEKVKEEEKDTFKEAIAACEKEFGKGTIISTENKLKTEQRDIISTGSLGLDLATGVGGFAKGTLVELLGWESSGKSTIALNVIAAAQAKGERCLLLDGEHSFDAKYAKKLGIDVNKLILSQPENIEAVFKIMFTLGATGRVGLIIIDSQTAFDSKKGTEGEVGDSKIGRKALLMGDGVMKALHFAARYNILIIFISQFRTKIGVMFGSPETTNGGNALQFYAHMRVRISKEVKKDGEGEGIMAVTTASVKKNKLARPFRVAEFNIVFGEGIDLQQEILDIGVKYKVLEKSGSWFSYNGTKLGQSTAAKTLLKDNPELASEIRLKILEQDATQES